MVHGLRQESQQAVGILLRERDEERERVSGDDSKWGKRECVLFVMLRHFGVALDSLVECKDNICENASVCG